MNQYNKNQKQKTSYTNRQIPFSNQIQTDLQKAKQEMDDARQRYKAQKRLTKQNTEQAKKAYEATVDKFLDKLKPYLKKEKPNLLLKPIWIRKEDKTIKEIDKTKLSDQELQQADKIVVFEDYGNLLNQYKKITTTQSGGLAEQNKQTEQYIPLDIPEYVTFRVHRELNQAYYDLGFSKLGEDWQTLQG